MPDWQSRATDIALAGRVSYDFCGFEVLRASQPERLMANGRKYGLVPHLVVAGAAKAVEFYQLALGAVEVVRMPDPNSDRLLHVELQIGDAVLFLCDDFPECSGHTSRAPTLGGTTPVTLHLDVSNCDEALARAQAAGATVTMPAQDMFWGDRYGKIRDPFGHEWSFAHPLTSETVKAA
jgi:PhnB protein